MMRRKSGLQRKFMSVLFYTTVVLLLLILVIINLALLNQEIRSYQEDVTIRMSVLADGINDNFDLKTAHVVASLIRKMHEAKENNDPTVEIWGTDRTVHPQRRKSA